MCNRKGVALKLRVLVPVEKSALSRSLMVIEDAKICSRPICHVIGSLKIIEGKEALTKNSGGASDFAKNRARLLDVGRQLEYIICAASADSETSELNTQ
jgi:hypothetical protein